MKFQENWLCHQSKDEIIMLECNKLKQVDSFKYLGDWVLEKMKRTRESELGKPVVLNTPPPKKKHLKITFYQSTVKSMLLYNVESFILTKMLREISFWWSIKMMPSGKRWCRLWQNHNRLQNYNSLCIFGRRKYCFYESMNIKIEDID